MVLKKLKFRNKLLLTFLVVFIPLILMGSILAFFQVKNMLQVSIERELQDATDSLSNQVGTSVRLSVKNRLHAIAEKNLDIASYYYSKHKSGLLTRYEAIRTIEEIFLNQPIGISGYIYCLNSKGKLIIHPNDDVKNSDVTGFDFVQQQMKIKDGYLSYDWKNPGEKKERAKVLYMVYFKPLDWIISVSAYRDEFDHLMDVEAFKERVLSYRTGETGYAFVLDEKGTLVIHPSLEGINPITDLNYPDEFIQQVLEKKNGKIKYFWKNPNESKAHEKIVIFKYLPEHKWIVACSSYVEEVFKPLDRFKNLLLVVLILVLVSSVGITYLISRSVTKPLESLMRRLEEGTRGDFSVRMEYQGAKEFSELSRYFNSFMSQLEKTHKELEAEIQKNIETQSALVENDLKLRGLFHQSFQYTGILSPSGILEEVNQSGLDFAGCTLADVVYKPFWQAHWWRHESKVREKLKAGIKKATQGKLIRFDTTIISKSDIIRDIDISMKPVFGPEGNVAFIITESRDITDYKKAALDRKKIAVQMEKSQKMEAIGTLAGGIAHDFNNILSGIMGHAQLAELSLDNPEKIKSHTAQIIRGANRAAGLTQQILMFSRQTQFEKKNLRIYLIVKEAIKLLRSSIPSTIEIAENIVSRGKIFADPTQMHQVVLNLCTNAYHAMDKGGVLTVSLEEVTITTNRDALENEIKSGKYIVLKIADTGHGMDEKTLSKAFEPYFTTKKAGKGTGFGLALVHAIVEEHGGFIDAKSLVGKGSHFNVFLPAIEQEVIQKAVLERDEAVRGGNEKIMVVDDEEDIRDVTKEFLQVLGYGIKTFENGAMAFEAFKKDPDYFDLVITDMTMPLMTGEALSRKILALRQDIPIILCTGYSETISKEAALDSGIQKYVEKPLSNKDLSSLVRELLDKP